MKKEEFENVNLVRKIAWSFHKSTGIDYKELFAEACLWYYEAVRTWSLERNTKLSTYAYSIIQKKLSDFAGIEKVRRMSGIYTGGTRRQSYNEFLSSAYSFEIAEIDMDSLKINNPETMLDFQPELFENFLLELPKDCQEIIRIIFENLDQIPPHLSPKMTRGKIIEILREKGISWPKIWNGFTELKLQFA
jgi:hypothetical protein